MDSFGPHIETYELRVLTPCNCRKHRVIHGDSQKVPGRYMSPNLDRCPPPKSWQFGVIIVTFRILNFAFSRLLLGKFLTIDEIVFLFHIWLPVILFSRLSFNIVLGACTLHVVQGMNHCMSQLQLMVPSLARQFFDHLSLFISWDLLEGSKGVKMDAVDKDDLPWLAMRQCARSIHEKIQNDSNSSLVPDLYIDLIFSIFMTRALFQLIYYFVCLVLLFLTISQMLDLREKLGVTIQHLIGPNNEQMLLGCCDSTKVHPRVIKPLWKAKMAYSYTTCNTVSWRNDFFCRCFSILWCAVLEKCQDARTWVLNWIFDDFCILKVFVEVKVAIRHCRHHFYHPHNQSSWIRKNDRMFQPGSIEDGVQASRRSQHFARQRCHRHHRFCTMVASA